MTSSITRRQALSQLGVGAALLAGATTGPVTAADQPLPTRSGRIKQSVCAWCYGKIPLEQLCAAAAEMGLASVELLQPKDFAIAKKHGLTCAMVSNPTTKVGDVTVGGISRAWNRLE